MFFFSSFSSFVFGWKIEFGEQRKEVSAKNEKLSEEAEAVLEVIGNPEVVGQLKQDKEQNMAWLKENYQVRFFFPSLFLPFF